MMTNSRPLLSVRIHLLLLSFVGVISPALGADVATSDDVSQDRPNIMWILSEDNSIHFLRLYGAPLGATPAIERLAAEGLTFEHAFSNAPVCSVARTTLMTGMLAPRVGFQYHRRSAPAALPDGGQLFPALLRQAGYYTTNNSKKDYNVVEGEVWHESSNKATWRNRPTPGTPFFHMMSTSVSHESSLHFSRQQMEVEPVTTSPDDVEPFPYHPDTATFRYTLARYYDRMRGIDREVDKVVSQLKEDGLLDNTIIFYFGDHGGVLPRSKGYVYDSGLHVPLVVRVPERWRSLCPFAAGSRVDGFVSFIDFGPTVLNLAGAEVPSGMDGRAFLGKGVTAGEVNSRDEAFGYADRFDEKYDLCRSLRRGRFHYIRNYQSFYPDGLQNNYRYQMLAYSEWRDLYRAGNLNEAQAAFFERRPVEMLFDVETDPHEIHNLAGEPEYAEVLRDLRGRLQQTVKSLPDLSFYPENYLVDVALPGGAEFGQAHADDIRRLVDIADLALLPFDEACPRIEAAMNSADRWERYWAVIVCSCFGKSAAGLAPQITALLDDDESLVRVRAAEFVGMLGLADPRPTLFEVLAESESPVETLLIMNTVVFLHDGDPAWPFDPAGHRINSGGEVGRRLEYLGKTPQQTRPRKKKTSQPSAGR